MHTTLFNGDDMMYLPKDRVVIQQAIENPGSVALPSTVVDHFIEKASHRWIMNRCICREGDHCTEYPHDLGCIFLGEAVLTINPKMGRLASKEEALAHARKARELGMVQLIGRDRIDNLWMGARPFGKLMTICHCCPCCCLFRVIPDLDPQNREKIRRMPGVEVWVDQNACKGCGKCTRGVCFVEAIQIINGKAEINENCRGCGRCVEACPHQAVHLQVTDTAYVQKSIARISSLVDLSSSMLQAAAPKVREKGIAD
jgi:ferredoxin